MAYVGVETERLFIRPTEMQDVDDIYAYLSDPEVMKYRTASVHSRDEVTRWVETIVTTGRTYTEFVGKVQQIVLKDVAKVIGYCYIDVPWPDGYRDVLVDGIADFVDLTYGLTRTYWGNGYATEAALGVLRYGFFREGFEKIGAAVDSRNEASISVLKCCGFTHSQKITWADGRVVDFYLLTKREFEGAI